MLRPADDRRVLAAATARLDRHGRPATANDLSAHALLRFGEDVAPWTLPGPAGEAATLAAKPRLRADDGDVVQQWCAGGYGIMMRSVVDIGQDLAAGRIERVSPSRKVDAAPIVALYASRDRQPREPRDFLDAIAATLRRQAAIA